MNENKLYIMNADFVVNDLFQEYAWIQRCYINDIIELILVCQTWSV